MPRDNGGNVTINVTPLTTSMSPGEPLRRGETRKVAVDPISRDEFQGTRRSINVTPISTRINSLESSPGEEEVRRGKTRSVQSRPISRQAFRGRGRGLRKKKKRRTPTI